MPNLVMLTLYSDTTHGHDIMEDPMLEFVALFASSRIVMRPSLERLLSTPVAPQLQDEAPTVMAP
jgi:hypothetical protein